ncbi:MAG: hypothetical protein IPL76_10930 [Gemmatimonadetes bacterium]|nr:hypothetical protein [Gemmatimonadota bacterium]
MPDDILWAKLALLYLLAGLGMGGKDLKFVVLDVDGEEHELQWQEAVERVAALPKPLQCLGSVAQGTMRIACKPVLSVGKRPHQTDLVRILDGRTLVVHWRGGSEVVSAESFEYWRHAYSLPRERIDHTPRIVDG